MKRPDTSLHLAAGHTVIAGALGLLLVLMLPIAATPAAGLLLALLPG